MAGETAGHAAATPAQPRSERLEVRCTAEQKELFLRAAAIQGQTLSDFLLDTARRAAEQAIQRHDIITLSLRDSQAFVQALLNPPEPNERLRMARARHAALVKNR